MMRGRQLSAAIAAVTLVGCLFASPVLAQDLQRGLQNYKAIMSGKKKLEQLSPQEQQEIIIIHRRVQAQRQGSNKSPACRDALTRAENAASELADYARRLRNCAEAQDYTDDCSTEFRRARSAHSDYEDAVSSVSSNCQ